MTTAEWARRPDEADVDAKTMDGRTTLTFAKGNPAIMAALRAVGARG